MARIRFKRRGWQSSMLLCAATLAIAQAQPASTPLNIAGKIAIDGRLLPYLIRHLPIASFPQLPPAVQAALEQRNCLIPQTYEAHQPENVIHGSFEKPGSSDWAALCSDGGAASLLVFFASRPAAEPFVLATAPETERLQLNVATGVLGFNWGIDTATPQQVHDAQASLDPRPPLLDHDALADSTVDHRTVYHFYAKSAWTMVEMPQP